LLGPQMQLLQLLPAHTAAQIDQPIQAWLQHRRRAAVTHQLLAPPGKQGLGRGGRGDAQLRGCRTGPGGSSLAANRIKLVATAGLARPAAPQPAQAQAGGA
jgi:hypothetical protein